MPGHPEFSFAYQLIVAGVNVEVAVASINPHTPRNYRDLICHLIE
jgi:hypothetical protein